MPATRALPGCVVIFSTNPAAHILLCGCHTSDLASPLLRSSLSIAAATTGSQQSNSCSLSSFLRLTLVPLSQGHRQPPPLLCGCAAASLPAHAALPRDAGIGRARRPSGTAGGPRTPPALKTPPPAARAAGGPHARSQPPRGQDAATGRALPASRTHAAGPERPRRRQLAPQAVCRLQPLKIHPLPKIRLSTARSCVCSAAGSCLPPHASWRSSPGRSSSSVLFTGASWSSSPSPAEVKLIERLLDSGAGML
ncbi:hypothetical protein U9M48_044260 [Paspalum notatum var. saurae]|uniref:Uncharacterized protein n=1 Tax=Paspalum notatum var. saurae TaxID=547442 RepID=A0AAQ3XGG9_PASNO